jgi:hypothetical protein
MALWGNNTALALTGTVATTNGSSTVTGSSTLFLSEIKPGDVIRVNSTYSKVTLVTSNTALTISPAWAIANTSGVTAQVKQAPKHLAAGTDLTVQSIGKVYGVDVNEATANNEIPGWIYTNVYTDMHGNIRRKSEPLAVLGSMSTAQDDEDTVYADYRLVIGTQPTSKTVTAASANTFTISVTSVPTGATINYRWQQAANANASFVDLTNTGTWTNTTTATVNFANSSLAGTGSIYRVQMSVTNGTAANTISSNAILTIA